jgi:hypothetical protein
MRISSNADHATGAAIGRIGRTEDVQWSPSGRRLALAGYLADRVLVLDVDVDVDRGGAPQRISLSGALEVHSPSFDHPHGVDWFDDDTVAVANRYGDLGIFELPARPAAGAVTLDPVRTIGPDRRDLVKNPGSLSIYPIGLGLFELVVCNNFVHHVSRHLIDRRDGYAVLASESLSCDGLRVPDGAAHSRSGRWLAICNHDGQSVLMFRNDGSLHDGSVPVGVLRNAGQPHGLVWSPDERWICVADAGTGFLRAYTSDDGRWDGDREPVSSIRILSDEVVEEGNFQPGEGGLKGIGLTPDGTVLASTCQEDPLVFIDMREVVGTALTAASPEFAGDAERARAFLLRYLDGARTRVDEATAAVRRTGEREVQLLLASRWWRVTAPVRRLSESLQYSARRARHRVKRLV